MSDRLGELTSTPSIDVSEEMGFGPRGDGVKNAAETATAVLAEIMADTSASPEARVQAAVYILGMSLQREHMEEYRRQQERGTAGG
jgi:hypothetical protein